MNKIAVLCNYSLNPNRIGVMERFSVVYDAKAKAMGYEVDWNFTADVYNDNQFSEYERFTNCYLQSPMYCELNIQKNN